MMNEAEKTEQLQSIAEQLKLIAETQQEQNALLRSIILQSEEWPARLMVGMYGPISVIDL